MELNKQSAALAALSLSIANTLVAFGIVDAVLAAASQAVAGAVASLVLIILHRRDANAVS